MTRRPFHQSYDAVPDDKYTDAWMRTEDPPPMQTTTKWAIAVWAVVGIVIVVAIIWNVGA